MMISGKKVQIWPGSGPDKPVIYLNTFPEEGALVYEMVKNSGKYDFSLVAVSELEWNHDLVPWDIPPVRKNDLPYTGGAQAYACLLTEQIIPKAEKEIQGCPPWRGIAGYSLAGLFAIYAFYCTDLFSRAASVSGSLWFPEFKSFIFSHTMKCRPECIYFSLGNKESKTNNACLRTVRSNTEEIEACYRNMGIDTVFRLNPGNHFKDTARRMADGILWLLDR